MTVTTTRGILTGMAYNPDQPREEDGKWAGGGGGSSAPHSSHLRGPYDVGGAPQPLEHSVGTQDPAEREWREDWVKGYLAEQGVSLEQMRAPNGNYSWSPSVSEGHPYPEWSRDDFTGHVRDTVEDGVSVGQITRDRPRVRVRPAARTRVRRR